MDIGIADRLNEIFRQSGFFDPSAPSDQVSVEFASSLMCINGSHITPIALAKIADTIDDPNNPNCRGPGDSPEQIHPDSFILTFKSFVDVSKIDPKKLIDGPRSSVRMVFLNSMAPSALLFDENKDLNAGEAGEGREMEFPEGPSLMQMAAVSRRLEEWTELDWTVFSQSGVEIADAPMLPGSVE